MFLCCGTGCTSRSVSLSSWLTQLPKRINKNVNPIILMAKSDVKHIKEHFNSKIGRKKYKKVYILNYCLSWTTKSWSKVLYVCDASVIVFCAVRSRDHFPIQWTIHQIGIYTLLWKTSMNTRTNQDIIGYFTQSNAITLHKYIIYILFITPHIIYVQINSLKVET